MYYSKQTAIDILDRVNEDHAEEVIKMKVKVEELHSGKLTFREMKSRANSGASGISLFSDNVGKIVNPR